MNLVCSIADFRLMLDDPVVQTLDILLSYFVRLFAKYFSQCSNPLPGWFVELLFADKIPLELTFQTCGFLFHRRPLAEAQLRETTLRDLIHRNAKRDLIDVMVMNLGDDNFRRKYGRGRIFVLVPTRLGAPFDSG